MLIYDQFCIKQKLQMSPIAQTSFLVGTFFAASHSKMALGKSYRNCGHFTVIIAEKRFAVCLADWLALPPMLKH